MLRKLGLYSLVMAMTGCGIRQESHSVPKAATVTAGNGLSVVAGDAGGIYISGQAMNLESQAVTLAGERFIRIHLAGFDGVIEPGQPEVPYTTIQLAVPNGARVSAVATAIGERRIVDLDYDLSYQDINPTHTFPVQTVARDPEAYARNHGDNLAEVLDVSYAGNVKIATIKVSPVAYHVRSRRLKIAEEFSLHISFDADATAWSIPPVGGNAASAAHLVVANPEQLKFEVRESNAKVDLVIAHVDHREALARYIAFKRESLGRTVREHYVEDLSAQAVKNIIADEYSGAEPPTQTLLIGNIDQIPSWRGSGDNTWTDFGYTTLDSGSVPDISLGRVPAHNAAELDAFIDKAMARELADRNVDDVLLTAGRDTGLGCPTNVLRVGQKFASSGNQINEIRQLRSNGASTNDVINAYNDSPNLVVYDGHGDRNGMQEIPLVISNLDRLTNSSFHIILDIACLNANWRNGASQRNFAESILLKPNAGAAGLLASGGSGYGHDFFQSIAEIMAEGRSAMLDRDETLMNEIGQTILAAKIRHGSQDRSYWNYYGDPASSVWEAEVLAK